MNQAPTKKCGKLLQKMEQAFLLEKCVGLFNQAPTDKSSPYI